MCRCQLQGTLVVWWASTGLIMMKSKAHGGPVRQLQFDATKVMVTPAMRKISEATLVSEKYRLACWLCHATHVDSLFWPRGASSLERFFLLYWSFWQHILGKKNGTSKEAGGRKCHRQVPYSVSQQGFRLFDKVQHCSDVAIWMYLATPP